MKTKNITKAGMLISVSLLQFKCNKCELPAKYSLIRQNKGLPKNYIQFGTRSIEVCEKHFKEHKDAVSMWQFQFK